MELSFIYTEDEYVSAARLFLSRTPHANFDLVLGLCVFLGALLVAALAGDPYLGGVVFIAGLVGFAFRYYNWRVPLRAEFRREPRFHEPYEVRFDEGGVVLRSKGFESRLDWDFYTEVLETPDFFFFVYGEGLFLLIPKRVLRRGQEAALREMLGRRLGSRLKTRGLPPPAPGARGVEYEPPAEPPDWR